MLIFPKDGNYLYDGCSLYERLFHIYIAFFFSFPFSPLQFKSSKEFNRKSRKLGENSHFLL